MVIYLLLAVLLHLVVILVTQIIPIQTKRCKNVVSNEVIPCVVRGVVLQQFKSCLKGISFKIAKHLAVFELRELLLRKSAGLCQVGVD